MVLKLVSFDMAGCPCIILASYRINYSRFIVFTMAVGDISKHMLNVALENNKLKPF